MVIIPITNNTIYRVYAGAPLPFRCRPIPAKGVADRSLFDRNLAFVKKLDPTRPVTAAICHPWEHPTQSWKDMQPAFTYLDVGGYNYGAHLTSPTC